MSDMETAAEAEGTFPVSETESAISKCESPEAVVFQIKEYSLNEQGIPIVSHGANQEDAGEVLNTPKSALRQRLQDAEPDPINYDPQRWRQYNQIRQKRAELADQDSSYDGCKLRTVQCLSFLCFLLSSVALLTDDLTSITGAYQYGYYSDEITCGWNAVHLIQYDVSAGITETSIKYTDCEDDDHLCHNVMVHGMVWSSLSVLAIVTALAVMLLFCCVFPLKPKQFEGYRAFSVTLLIFHIVFLIVAVVIWVSDDYCSDRAFLRNFYDKQIVSIDTGISIDVTIASMLCSLLCISWITCIKIQNSQ